MTLQGAAVELSPREFALLCALLMPPGLVRSRQELLAHGLATLQRWTPLRGHPGADPSPQAWSRPGLGEGGGITTVRQRGYRFSLDNLPAS